MRISIALVLSWLVRICTHQTKCATGVPQIVDVTMVAEHRHTVLHRPLDALQIKNFQTFTPTELIDVQAAADILTHDIMHIMRMMRQVAWPSLCDAMAKWMVQFEGT